MPITLLEVVKSRSKNDDEVRAAVKRLFFPLLAFFLFCDLVCAVVLLMEVCEWDRSKLSDLITGGHLWSWEHATADCLLLAALRVLLLPFFTWLGVVTGTPSYAKNKAPAPARPAKTEHSLMGAAGEGYLLEQPLVDSETAPNQAAQQEASAAATKALADATDETKTEAKWKAKSRKYSILAIVFILSTATQVYIGLKVSNFVFNDDKAIKAVLMCLTVLWVNAEVWASRHIVAELTKHQGLYLPHIHQHPIFYESSVACHWCDLCSTRIKQHAWRCKLCDFDLCCKCAARTDAAEVGENVLRSDTGVKKEEGLDNSVYFKRAIQLAAPEAKLVSGAFVLLSLYCGTQIALPFYQGHIIDYVSTGNNDGFISHIEVYIGIMAAQGLLSALYSAVFAVVSRRLVFHVRNTLFEQIVVQDVAFFDGTTSGHMTSRLTNDVNMMMQPIQSSLSQVLQNIFMLLGGLFMCYYTSYQLSMLAFVTVGPIMYLWDLYASWSRRLNRLMLAAWGEANSIANEAIRHVRTVKSFSTERREIGLYAEASQQALDAGIKDAWGNGLMTALTGYLDLGTGVLILWYGGYLVMHSDENNSNLTIGKLVTFQLYWNMMNNAYQSLQGLITSFTRAAAGAEKVFSLWDSIPDIQPNKGIPVDWQVKGEITIVAAEFHYLMRPENQVLKGLNLHIPAGSVCALVGRSGGGKSTVINLLLRFYDVRAGCITLDGRRYQDLKVHDIRKLMGLVAQDTELFARTIQENISYGLDESEYTQADVIAAAKKAQAHDFITEMKDGYDTRVGEKGGRISGGQRQRLAIARIFLRKPKVVLLDEATSALDEESQAAVQKGLDQLIEGAQATVVVVAHRLSTVRNAHKIAVVDKGVVIEEGSHDELVDQGGVYSALVKQHVAKEATVLHQGKAEEDDEQPDGDGAAKKGQAEEADIDKLFKKIDKKNK